MSEKQVPAAAPAASPASGGPPTYGQINRVDGPPANANANDGSSYDTEANTYRADGHGPGGRRESTDVKAANGPGPADPYYHDEKGRPIIMEDELRVAGEWRSLFFCATMTANVIDVMPRPLRYHSKWDLLH